MNVKKEWYEIRAAVGGRAEVFIYGEIGWEVTAKTFLEDLRDVAGPDTALDVHINSPGGSVWDGLAIYNTLKRRRAPVTVYIDGIALSMGSIIAMAGDTVIMPRNAWMMIHDPWWGVVGTSDDMRKRADVLDKIRGQAAAIYVEKTGLPMEEVIGMMAEETWMTGDEAKEKGFVDEVVEEEIDLAACASGFDLSRCRALPDQLRGIGAAQGAAAAADEQGKGRKSAMKTTQDQGSAAQPTPAANPDAGKTDAPTTPAPDAGVNALREKAAEDARAFFTSVMGECRKAKLPQEKVDEIVTTAKTMEQARAMIIDAVADMDATPEPRNYRAEVIADGVDRFRQGAERALLARAGLDGGERNEFTGLTLRELARESLAVRNISVRGMPALEMVGAAFVPMSVGYHGTSDFTHILANVANKAMLKGFEEAEETFRTWTAKGTLADFKPTKRIDLNLFPTLLEVPEGAEYKHATIGDRGETIQLATYGRTFSVTRQAIINDDMAMFTRVPMRMGRAAIRTVGNLVYAVLTSNPTMSDGVALFHASHNNLAASGGAPSTATLDAMRTAMATQKDPDGHANALNIRPAYVIVPVALEGTTKTALESEYDTAKGDKRVPNSVRGMATVVSDGRLDAVSTTAWYGAANQNQHDTIEVAYLDGVETPTLEQRDGWNVDGVEMKVRLDAGVKALDWRGFYKNPGA